MRALRQAVTALGITAVIAVIVRLRGTGGTPPKRGGWKEIPLEELSAPAAGPPATPTDRG